MIYGLASGYYLLQGNLSDRNLLIDFVQKTYQELFPDQKNYSYLKTTVRTYFSSQTPLWWISTSKNVAADTAVACLWMGNGIEPQSGDRFSQIMLIFVCPTHRNQGLAKYLITTAQNWSQARGDSKIGLQVFNDNQAALKLYQKLGFETQSLLMTKTLG